MAKIEGIRISNYRGFREFECHFGETNFICLIGRGDSGKSTILDSIDKALSSQWNLVFHDTDFHNGNLEKPIELEVSVYNVPEELLLDEKFGLYIRFLAKTGEILDDPLAKETDGSTKLLTIRLSVDKSLEPKWCVISKRPYQEDKEISSKDRAKLSIFSITDYVDRHFSWSKGNPLYSLVPKNAGQGADERPLLDALREAKRKIDNSDFSDLDEPLKKVIATAKGFGIDIKDASTTIDFRDLTVNEGKVSLHSGSTPFRLKGKGSKRLISLAIQSELTNNGGTILIDELEQGLEPDRAQHLAQSLKCNSNTQSIITTHSRDVIVELDATDIFRVKKGQGSLFRLDKQLQGVLRSNPEAFFCKSVIVCEGVTEVGLCRALNQSRISINKPNSAFLGVRFADGHGSEMVEYANAFNAAGYRTCLYCDSDEPNVQEKKTAVEALGITVIDCEYGLSFEKQLFKDLEWQGIKKLLKYRIEELDHQGVENSLQAVENSLQAKCNITLNDNWMDNESIELRSAIGEVAGSKRWFKRVDHGEFAGKICLIDENIPSSTGFGKILSKLSSWIDND